MTNTFTAPSGEQREALRNAGWGFHIRYLRGTVEVLGRHGEGYVFPLTSHGMQQLHAFIDECVLTVSVADREAWEHRAVLAGVNDVDSYSTEELQAAVDGGAQ